MKLVTFFSLKGGAGKTTALMAAASGLRRKGLRIALFEADKNDSLGFWRDNALENETWDNDCRIYDAKSQMAFEQAFAEAQGAGYDVALLDAEGGESELNTSAVLSSDLILIPLSLSALDIEYGIRAFQFAREVLTTNGVKVPMAFLICRFPSGKDKLTKADRESLDILSKLPQVSTRLPMRAAFSDIATAGMLHLYYDELRGNPAQRVTSFSVGVALKEAQSLATDVTDALEMELEHANP